MYISDFAVDDFRSYRRAVVRFTPGICVLIGANGQGKTNLVEALAYLASFSSHRVHADTALVRLSRTGTDPAAAVVRAKVHHGQRERVLELEIVRGRANRARINRTQVPPKELLGLVKTVVFAPEDLSLVKGDPTHRRHFLDEVAAQLWPAHRLAVANFEKLARQRGALLKQLSKDRRAGRELDRFTLDIFTQKFLAAAVEVTQGRLNLLQRLDEILSRYYHHVSDSDRYLRAEYDFSALKPLQEIDVIDNIGLLVRFQNDPDRLGEHLQQALERVREEEIHRGVNLVGPHRDDLSLYLDHLPVKGYASHGESWSVALSLKLACFELLGGASILEVEADHSLDMPVLILDDVFAELDARRRQKLLDIIDKCEQVFITAAVAADVPEGINGIRYEVVLDQQEGSICRRIVTEEDGEDGEV